MFQARCKRMRAIARIVRLRALPPSTSCGESMPTPTCSMTLSLRAMAHRVHARAWSVEWNALLVAIEPGVERLQLRVQRSRLFEVARAAVVILEVALELKHVAEIFGARKTEGAERRGRKVVVPNLLP